MNAVMNSEVHGPAVQEVTRFFVCCLVDSEWQAINIVGRCRSVGYTHREISLLFPNRSNRALLAIGSDDRPDGCARFEPGIDPGQLENALNWLAGFSSLQMPPLGSFLAAGPIIDALSGWNKPFICDVTLSLRTFGIPGDQAQHYAERLTGGEIFIAAHVDDWQRADKAQGIFSRWGAKDIGSA